MRKRRIFAATAAIGLTVVALATVTSASTAASNQSATTTAKASYVVLADEGYSARSLAATLRTSGATVTSVNNAIGLVTVTSTKAGFAASTRGLEHVAGVASNRSIGFAPKPVPTRDRVEKEHVFDKSRANGTAKIPPPPPGGDPLDGLLWGMDMIRAVRAHAVDQGDSRVTVGVLDTGVQGTHPDLAANFDDARSRNFTTDMADIDGTTCEYAGCVDPPGWDDNGHGTHVAGTIAASLNGFGLSGVAPDVSLVNIRGGQDSGYFFLGPVTNALTYAGNAGIDVVNMSFYVDPWLYNCIGGAPEDTAAQAADQEAIIEGMTRALNYAHEHDVTLLGSLGNNHEDLANPRHDFSSPDYGAPAHERTIDNDTCFDLPVEGPHVLGVSSLGPSGTKSDFSNYTTDLGSGEIEFSAPGGWYRDGFGTDSFMTNGNLILSTAPKHVLVASGEVNKNGNITKPGRLNGVLRQCNAQGRCGYYQWLQGTSMATPHAVGVAALAVSRHGTAEANPARGLTMAPDSVAGLMASTAINHACPAGRVQSYIREGRDEEYTARCVGTPDFNGFYGAGIVNALGVVR